MGKVVAFPARCASNTVVLHNPPKGAVPTRVTNILRQYVKGHFTQNTACCLLEQILPPGTWVDCGSYHVCLTYGDDDIPLIDVVGKEYSGDGRCPACFRKYPLWILGGGNRAEVLCAHCSTVYTTNENALRKRR